MRAVFDGVEEGSDFAEEAADCKAVVGEGGREGVVAVEGAERRMAWADFFERDAAEGAGLGHEGEFEGAM